jgi:hypothetical protein
MQRITFFIALIMGFCLQPVPVFAQDQDQNKSDAKSAESAPHTSKEKPKASKQVQTAKGEPRSTREEQGNQYVRKGDQSGDLSRGDKSKGKNAATSTVDVRRSPDATRGNTEAISRNVQQTNQRQSQQSQSQYQALTVQGNRGNRYNGQWVAANTHGDWDRNSNHRWNNHDYRWYDGGWLIIESDVSPGYYQTGSLVIRVKHSLADQGYYNGHFSTTVGPHTRQAISNYESDKGLQVNGQIDGPLLASLGLE